MPKRLRKRMAPELEQEPEDAGERLEFWRAKFRAAAAGGKRLERPARNLAALIAAAEVRLEQAERNPNG